MRQPEAPANESAGAPAAGGHPAARVFHLLFKGTAALFYILGGLLPWKKSFTIQFTILLLLLVLDFWTVKNVTGRLLVGLRWWNDVSENGEGWRFEALGEGQRAVNSIDKWWFWVGLAANVAIWLLFGFFTLLRWDWLLVCVLALVLGVANLYGYFKCSREAKKMLSDYAQNATRSALNSTLQAAINRV
ncbi:hypothetical protein BSKO_04383 [Bryopsis sp. KO-2023]|nr:hypothetical protein BSKO_04383 [Bryopsis sp. KO-2023]